MPIFYDINPEHNLLLYICIGECTGAEFFKTMARAGVDRRRRAGMKVIIDILSAEISIEVSDLHHVLDMNKKKIQNGRALEHVVVVTKSSSLNLMADALALMSGDIVLNLDIIHTPQDAIYYLDYSEVSDEIIQFWAETKSKVVGIIY